MPVDRHKNPTGKHTSYSKPKKTTTKKHSSSHKASPAPVYEGYYGSKAPSSKKSKKIIKKGSRKAKRRLERSAFQGTLPLKPSTKAEKALQKRGKSLRKIAALQLNTKSQKLRGKLPSSAMGIKNTGLVREKAILDVQKRLKRDVRRLHYSDKSSTPPKTLKLWQATLRHDRANKQRLVLRRELGAASKLTDQVKQNTKEIQALQKKVNATAENAALDPKAKVHRLRKYRNRIEALNKQNKKLSKPADSHLKEAKNQFTRAQRNNEKAFELLQTSALTPKGKPVAGPAFTKKSIAELKAQQARKRAQERGQVGPFGVRLAGAGFDKPRPITRKGFKKGQLYEWRGKEYTRAELEKIAEARKTYKEGLSAEDIPGIANDIVKFLSTPGLRNTQHPYLAITPSEFTPESMYEGVKRQVEKRGGGITGASVLTAEAALLFVGWGIAKPRPVARILSALSNVSKREAPHIAINTARKLMGIPEKELTPSEIGRFLAKRNALAKSVAERQKIRELPRKPRTIKTVAAGGPIHRADEWSKLSAAERRAASKRNLQWHVDQQVKNGQIKSPKAPAELARLEKQANQKLQDLEVAFASKNPAVRRIAQDIASNPVIKSISVKTFERIPKEDRYAAARSYLRHQKKKAALQYKLKGPGSAANRREFYRRQRMYLPSTNAVNNTDWLLAERVSSSVDASYADIYGSDESWKNLSRFYHLGTDELAAKQMHGGDWMEETFGTFGLDLMGMRFVRNHRAIAAKVAEQNKGEHANDELVNDLMGGGGSVPPVEFAAIVKARKVYDLENKVDVKFLSTINKALMAGLFSVDRDASAEALRVIDGLVAKVKAYSALGLDERRARLDEIPSGKDVINEVSQVLRVKGIERFNEGLVNPNDYSLGDTSLNSFYSRENVEAFTTSLQSELKREGYDAFTYYLPQTSEFEGTQVLNVFQPGISTEHSVRGTLPGHAYTARNDEGAFQFYNPLESVDSLKGNWDIFQERPLLAFGGQALADYSPTARRIELALRNIPLSRTGNRTKFIATVNPEKLASLSPVEQQAVHNLLRAPGIAKIERVIPERLSKEERSVYARALARHQSKQEKLALRRAARAERKKIAKAERKYDPSPEYINRTALWHGGGSTPEGDPLTLDHLTHTRTHEGSLFGQGIYSTVSKSMAISYTKHGSASGHAESFVYKITPNVRRVVDLEEPVILRGLRGPEDLRKTNEFFDAAMTAIEKLHSKNFPKAVDLRGKGFKQTETTVFENPDVEDFPQIVWDELMSRHKGLTSGSDNGLWETVSKTKRKVYETENQYIFEAIQNAAWTRLQRSHVLDSSTPRIAADDNTLRLAFTAINEELNSRGFDAYTHIGGTRMGRGRKLHQVVVFFNPGNESFLFPFAAPEKPIKEWLAQMPKSIEQINSPAELPLDAIPAVRWVKYARTVDADLDSKALLISKAQSDFNTQLEEAYSGGGGIIDRNSPPVGGGGGRGGGGGGDPIAMAGGGSPDDVEGQRMKDAIRDMQGYRMPKSTGLPLRVKRAAVIGGPMLLPIIGISAADQDFRNAAMRDAHDLVVGFVPSGYEFLRATGDALLYGASGGFIGVHKPVGSTSRIEKMWGAIKETDPIALAFQGRWDEAYKAIKERPVSFAIEVGGAYTFVGKTAGAFARGIPKSLLPNKSAWVNQGSRPGRFVFGEVEIRSQYSPNLITAAVQRKIDVVESKALAGRKPVTRMRQTSKGTVPYGDYGSTKANLAAINRGQRIQIAIDHEADRLFAVGLLGQRHNLAITEKEISGFGKEAHKIHKLAPHALYFTGTRLVRGKATAIADLKRLRDEIQEKIDRTGNLTHPDNVSRHYNLDIINGLIDHPQIFQDNRLWEVTNKMRDAEDVRQNLLVQTGDLNPKAAEYAPWIPYAVHHMGARWNREKNAFFLDSKPLSIERIKNHAEANGVDRPMMVTTRIIDGSQGDKIKMLTLPSSETFASAGRQIEELTSDMAFSALMRQGGLSRTILDKKRFAMTVFDRMALREKGGKRPIYFKDPVEFDEFVKHHLGSIYGTELKLIDLHNFADELETIKALDMSRITAGDKAADIYKGLNEGIGAVLDKTKGVTPSEFEGRYIAVPAHLVDRLNKHAQYEANVSKLLRRINREFKGSVLAFSPKWHIGNAVDMISRLAFEGANPFAIPFGKKASSGSIGRALLAELKNIDENAYNDLIVLIGGGHLANVGAAEIGLFSSAQRNLIEAYSSAQRRALATIVRSPGNLYRSTQRGSFSVAQHLEHALRATATGKAAKQVARSMGKSWIEALDMTPEVIRQLALGLAGDRNVAVRYGELVNKVMGDYTTMSPEFRRAVMTFAPFALWLRASTKWAISLPKNSPIRSSIIASVNRVTEPERRKLGLSVFDPTAETQPDYMLGSIPVAGDVGKLYRTNAYTSFGPLTDFEGLANFLLPQYESIRDAYQGQLWTGEDIINPDGTPLSNSQRPGVMLQALIETYVMPIGLAHKWLAQGDPDPTYLSNLYAGKGEGIGGITKRQYKISKDSGTYNQVIQDTKSPHALSLTKGIEAKIFSPVYEAPNKLIQFRREEASKARQERFASGEDAAHEFLTGTKPAKTNDKRRRQASETAEQFLSNK